MIAFIKRIIRALGIPYQKLPDIPNVQHFTHFLVATLKNFMGVYGIFSASIPNVDNNALYGGIVNKPSNFVNARNKNPCGIEMYYFEDSTVKTLKCSGTNCNVHLPMCNWIHLRKIDLEQQNVNKIVTAFLRMFLIIFEVYILGIGNTEHQTGYINAEYATMAINFKSHMERSLQRGQRWTSRSRR